MKQCIGQADIASAIARYPVLPNDCVRYVLEFFRLFAYIILCHCREIFYGHRWLEDSRFFSPMVILSFGHVFIGDFVSFNMNGVVLIGRVLKFFLKVCVHT